MRSELKIDGMTCAACSGRIERVLAKTNGIEEINVNLTTETATVSFDQTHITNDEIIDKIKKMGLDFRGLRRIKENSNQREFRNLKIYLMAL